MTCQSSKFIFLFLLTFLAGVGIVQIWQSATNLSKPNQTNNLSLSIKPIEFEWQKLRRETWQMSCQEIKRWGGGFAPKKQTINGGVLNTKSCMVEPIYPQSAIENKVDRVVNVEVLVDGFGKVQSAKAISGNSIFHKSAVNAAFKTQVCPTLLGGEPMNVRGVLVYKFPLPNS